MEQPRTLNQPISGFSLVAVELLILREKKKD
jgi:hypothetical protein